jgi:hypothetical protein
MGFPLASRHNAGFMQRVMLATLQGALAAALSGGGCESAAPASTGNVADHPPPRAATDWAGVRGEAPTGSPIPTPTAGSGWVLHIGDSFVHASLWQNLRPLFKGVGDGYVVQATTATYTTTWANSVELDRWLARGPALVLVTLGANEVDMPAPNEHARAVEAIAKKIAAAGASCVWMTPPMWKRETGILQVIHDHCAPCLFFDSDAVLGGLSPEERQRDRIHPNERGGERWAHAFWEWLLEHDDPSKGSWALMPFERRGS